KRLVFENCRAAGEVIGGLNHLLRLMAGMYRGKPQRGTLLQGETLPATGRIPRVAQRLHQEGARRLPLRFGDRDLGLNHRIVAQRSRAEHRHLGAGDLDKSIERRARDPERHAGEGRAVDLIGGEPIERAALAGFGSRFPGEGVARRHEEIRYRVTVASRAFEANDLPDVANDSLAFRKQHGALSRLAIGTKAWLAFGIDQRRMSAEPLRMTAAARVEPRPRRAVTTLGRRRFDGWSDRAPGENRILAAEDLLCHGRVAIGGGHRAARRPRNA